MISTRYSIIILLLLIINNITAQTTGVSAGYISVIDFGAKADSTTDNTESFQKALQAASVKGGIVYVPSGT